MLRCRPCHAAITVTSVRQSCECCARAFAGASRVHNAKLASQAPSKMVQGLLQVIRALKAHTGRAIRPGAFQGEASLPAGKLVGQIGLGGHVCQLQHIRLHTGPFSAHEDAWPWVQAALGCEARWHLVAGTGMAGGFASAAQDWHRTTHK